MGKNNHIKPDIVFLGDDFTGASDTLATWARQGTNARLFLHPPTDAEINGLDCVGIATALRSMDPIQAGDVMKEVAEPLANLKASFYHFKICSTFDSSAEIGNVAVACDALAKAIGSPWTAIIGGQPSLGRYCVFGNLFAKSSDGVIHRIDRHPVVSKHPVTPIKEADIRKHFATQGWDKIGLIDRGEYEKGLDHLVTLIEGRLSSGETHTLFDAEEARDLHLIGLALRKVSERRVPLVVGASSVAQALSGSYEPVSDMSFDLPRFKGPVFAFAGSRSSLTAEQVEQAQGYKTLSVSPRELLEGKVLPSKEKCRDFLGQGHNVLLHISAEKIEGIDRQRLAQIAANLVSDIVGNGAPNGRQLGCLAIAGGDTSSLIVQALKVSCLSMITEIDKGVPLVQIHAAQSGLNGLPVMLKGGQMGKVDLFTRLANSVTA